MDFTFEKKSLRAEARARRAKLARAMPDHAALLGGHAAALDAAKGTIVGGYMALAGEADPSLLMEHLAARGAKLCMPRVTAKTEPLSFHVYEPGMALSPGAFGIAEPDPESPRADPQLVLVPLLAFDAAGHRLGFGGGYYDRTLKALRTKGAITAVGVAYQGQEVENLPYEDFDESLDMVLTEAGLHRFAMTP